MLWRGRTTLLSGMKKIVVCVNVFCTRGGKEMHCILQCILMTVFYTFVCIMHNYLSKSDVISILFELFHLNHSYVC